MRQCHSTVGTQSHDTSTDTGNMVHDSFAGWKQHVCEQRVHVTEPYRLGAIPEQPGPQSLSAQAHWAWLA